MTNNKLLAAFLVLSTMLACAAPALAVDGTIEINQAKVMAAGGFPYTIATPNTSYRLTGSLTVPSGKDGIDVNTNNVTVDLNGFSIVGPGSAGNGTGINAPGANDVTVENGTVSGFLTGVVLNGFGLVKNLHVDSSASDIDAGNNALIESCTANSSSPTVGVGIACFACTISGSTATGAADGIECTGNGCVISGNTVSSNSTGISCVGAACLISGNTIFSNTSHGILGDATSGYGGNILNSNGLNVFGGVNSLGHNLCNGTAC